MVGTVKSRPNFYEKLGLTPAATGDEISRAFASECNPLRPHIFGGVAEVCVAYETLKDPVRRRAYDASLGLTPEPAPPNPPVEPLSARPSVSQTQVSPADQLVVAAGSPPASNTIKPRSDPLPDRASVPLNPASLRRQTHPMAGEGNANPTPQAEPGPAPGGSSEPGVALKLGRDVGRVAGEEQWNRDAKPIEWKQIGIGVGGLIAAAGLLGGLAGWWSGSEIGEVAEAKSSVSVSLSPPNKTAPVAVPPPPIQALANRPDRPSRPETELERAPAPVRSAEVEEPQELASPAQQADLNASPIEQAADDTPAAPAPAAAMPLPNRVIARTIDRIGYACGGVASTTPVEGDAPGVYKVTCTSGQSYQAKPVKGRYRFRRWAGQ